MNKMSTHIVIVVMIVLYIIVILFVIGFLFMRRGIFGVQRYLRGSYKDIAR